MGHFSLYPQNFFRLAYFHSPMNQMIPTMSHIIVTHEQNFFSKNYQNFFFPLYEKVELRLSKSKIVKPTHNYSKS